MSDHRANRRTGDENDYGEALVTAVPQAHSYPAHYGATYSSSNCGAPAIFA